MTKDKAGRPPLFETVEELEEKIDAYFKICDKGKVVQRTIRGEVVDRVEQIPYSIIGLAVHLGTTRETLKDYGDGMHDKRDDRFSYAIKKAKAKVEANMVERALTTNGAGSIFVLKASFGYKEKQEVDLNHNVVEMGSIKKVVGDKEEGLQFDIGDDD